MTNQNAAAAPAPIALNWTVGGDLTTATHRGAWFTISNCGAAPDPELSFQIRENGTAFRVPGESVAALKAIAEREAGYVEDSFQRAAADKAARDKIAAENARMTRSLLRCLKYHGFTAYRLLATTPGGGGIVRVQKEAELIGSLTATDESRLNVTHDLTGNGATLLLVYGNSAEELVADWSVPADAAVASMLQEAIDKYIDRNIGR